MRALTLKHPWPWAICHMGKRIENRTWFPSQAQLCVGDWFAIHGGKVPACDYPVLIEAASIAAMLGRGLGNLQSCLMPGIVALARYGGDAEKENMEADFWFEGPCGWLLNDVLVLPEVIPTRGAQGLWKIPDYVSAKLYRYLIDQRKDSDR